MIINEKNLLHLEELFTALFGVSEINTLLLQYLE